MFTNWAKHSFTHLQCLLSQNDQSTNKVKVIGGDELSALTGKVSLVQFSCTVVHIGHLLLFRTQVTESTDQQNAIAFVSTECADSWGEITICVVNYVVLR